MENLEGGASKKGLGEIDIPQEHYRCFGLVGNNEVLFRARIAMARLPEVVAAKSRKRIKDENQVESNNSQS